jgi:hypothetical protein
VSDSTDIPRYQDLPPRVRRYVAERDFHYATRDEQTQDVSVSLKKEKDLILPEELPALRRGGAIISITVDHGEGLLCLTFPTVSQVTGRALK